MISYKYIVCVAYIDELVSDLDEKPVESFEVEEYYAQVDKTARKPTKKQNTPKPETSGTGKTIIGLNNNQKKKENQTKKYFNLAILFKICTTVLVGMCMPQ